jgi:chromosome segregation ATPase
MSEDLTKRLSSSDGEKLTQILTAAQSLDLRVGNVEQKVEERLYDTRPIWEKVQAGLTQIQADTAESRAHITQIRADMVHLGEGQQRLEQGQEFLRGEMREMRTQLRDFSRKFSIFNDTLTQIQADYRDIYDRVRELELGRN